MVGGAEEEFTAAKELLSCMGANVVYCGQVGTGQVRDTLVHPHIELLHSLSLMSGGCVFFQAAKICNNMLLAIGMIGTSETMNLGIRYKRVIKK